MALSDQNNMVMPVAPFGGNMGGGFGGFGGDGWWLILLLLCFNGGWGGFGGFGGAGMAMMDGGFGLYPWLNNSQNLNGGFRDQMLNSNIQGIQNSITSGFGDVQNSLCGGFAGVNASINATQNAIAAQLYGNQISSLERSFAAQTANTQGLTNLSSQLSQCCCDNRLATCQTQNIVQNEGNATRFAEANNTRDIIESQNRNSQAILDKLCQLELDGLKQDNANLRTQLNMANLQASQTAQTAELRQSNATQLNNLVSELRSCPIPAQPVYGNQAIFSCGQNVASGCGCGM
jgi:hypothetical protein